MDMELRENVSLVIKNPLPSLESKSPPLAKLTTPNWLPRDSGLPGRDGRWLALQVRSAHARIYKAAGQSHQENQEVNGREMEVWQPQPEISKNGKTNKQTKNLEGSRI